MGTQLGQIKMASVSSKKLKKACGALAKYLSEVAEKDEGMEALIGAEETPVYVTVNMVHAPRAPHVNPYTIKIPHTMLDDDSDVYVIVKNPVSAYDEKIDRRQGPELDPALCVQGRPGKGCGICPRADQGREAPDRGHGACHPSHQVDCLDRGGCEGREGREGKGREGREGREGKGQEGQEGREGQEGQEGG